MSKTTNKYSLEVRERAVRMVLDNLGGHENRWAAILSSSAKIGCATQTLNEWVKKAEVSHRHSPWRSFDAAKSAALEWVDWFNSRRWLGPIGNFPSAKAEANFYAARETKIMAAQLISSGVRHTRCGSSLNPRGLRPSAQG